ncbi:MAG: glycosyltransferase family 4 protein [Spirochaetes bacterium]|nr:glycosyltransferase family 4 protein [Spirochaetota bacterium]
MIIGIDGTSLCRKITGIEYYTLDLIRNVLKFDKRNEYRIFFRKEIHPKLAGLKDKAKFLICPINNQIFCEQIWLPYITRRERIDIMHFPAFPPGILSKKNFIFTIHDATLWKYSNTLSWKGLYYMKPLTSLGAKRAKKILTVSNNSKKDLTKLLKIPENKIVSIYESIKEEFRIIKDEKLLDKVKRKYNLPDRFILSVGSLEPRKNLTNLLKAFHLIKKSFPKNEHKLVLIGRKAWGSSSITNQIKELELEDHVISTGYLPDADLICIYNLAEIFVFPSIYEGFGLPILEAMACGTPVISSNSSSLPEVVGSAGLMINPFHVDEIKEALTILIHNTKSRENLINLGKERVKQFSWEDSAKNVITLYQDLYMK